MNPPNHSRAPARLAEAKFAVGRFAVALDTSLKVLDWADRRRCNFDVLWLMDIDGFRLGGLVSSVMPA